MIPRDHKDGEDLNNQTLFDNSRKYASVFTFFYLIRRHFRSSSAALKNYFFPYLIYFTWNEYICMNAYICHLCKVKETISII